MRFPVAWALLFLSLFESPLGAAFNSPAHPRVISDQHVVLLTSLDMSTVRLPFYLFWRRPYYRKYEGRLESAFRSYFEERGYSVDILADSTQADLWQALHSPKNVAVYWLSHAAGARGTGVGLQSAGTIADIDGFDVTPAFQQVHPNLKFLGVVGCNSEGSLFKELADYHVLSDNPALQVRAYNLKIDARQGLNQLMKIGAQVISAPAIEMGYESACPVKRGFPLQVIRHTPTRAAFIPAARLERDGTVLGIFPIAKPGETQTLNVYLELPIGPVQTFDLKLVEDAGQNLGAMATEVAIGDLELSSPWPGARWQPFANRDGRPVGVTSHIYRYTGAALTVAASGEAQPGEAAPVEYHPFDCAPMKAR